MLFENVLEVYVIIINFGCIIFLIICLYIRYIYLVKVKVKILYLLNIIIKGVVVFW